MNREKSHLIAMLRSRAADVGTVVAEVDNLAEALDYALKVTREKAPLEPLLPLPESGRDEVRRVLAAPGLSPQILAGLADRGEVMGITVIGGNLRGHLAGVDVGFSVAELILAETATAVLAAPGEDERLAGMISEIHVVAADCSRLVETSYEAEGFLEEILGGPMYAAFISGSSRTSDIERVLTTGVHGPLEMHLVLMKGLANGITGL